MRITVEFENLKEIEEFCDGVLIAPGIANEARQERKEAPAEVKEEKPKKSTPKPEKAKEEAPAEVKEEPAEEVPFEEEKPAEEPKAEAPKVSIEEVRKVLADMQAAGKKQQVKELVQSFGVKNLTELGADRYAELIEKAKEI